MAVRFKGLFRVQKSLNLPSDKLSGKQGSSPIRLSYILGRLCFNRHAETGETFYQQATKSVLRLDNEDVYSITMSYSV